MEFKDYYQVLGVDKSADADAIKKAFRQLARQHHPDHAAPEDRPAAEAKFKEITEAYEVLGDADKRAKYDQLGANWQDYERTGGFAQGHPGMDGVRFHRASGPGGAEFHFGGTGFSDFFEQFFGGFEGDPFGATGQAGRHGFQTRGQDVEAEISVPLREALAGAKRTVTLERVDPASGERRRQSYQVTIPAGVRHGQRIRLTGQGESGHSGGLAGDLYLRVSLAPHPDYRVEDTDLIYTLELPAWDAALGLKAEIPLPDGKRVKASIPPGMKSGGKIRLRGLGLPGASGPGDLYVEAKVTVPPANARTKDIWERLKSAAS